MSLGTQRSALYAAYGFAHAGKSLFLVTSELYFAFYLTEVCAMSARVMGLAVGGTLALSAVTDLPIGALMRRRIQSAADAAGAQMLATAVCAMGFCGFAVVGQLSGEAPRAALAVASLLVFRLSYSLLDIPQNAIMTFVTGDDRQRASLATVRYVFSSSASILAAVAFLPLFARGARGAAAQFMLFVLLSSLFSLCASALLWFVLRRRREPLSRTASGASPSPDLQSPLSIGRLALLLFLTTCAASAFSRLEPYFAAYGLATPNQGERFMVYGGLGTLLSQPLWWATARCVGL